MKERKVYGCDNCVQIIEANRDMDPVLNVVWIKINKSSFVRDSYPKREY
jgi:hypothetical protein